MVHQQIYVIQNTAHRPSTQASYTASRVRPKRKISCAAARIAATLTISFPWFFLKHNCCIKPYVLREPRRDLSNRRLNEHGIYIRHCQESNSQSVPSQVGADTTRPQWQTTIERSGFRVCQGRLWRLLAKSMMWINISMVPMLQWL